MEMKELTALGARVARAQDRALARMRFDATKRRVLANAKAPRRRGVHYAWAAALVISGAAFAAWWLSQPPARTPLSAGGAASEGQWLGAPADAPLAVRFDDGSSLELAPGARARIATLDDQGVRVVVEQGTVDVSVRHVAGIRWIFDVGPFVVEVTGTHFRAGWNAATTELMLELLEGSVRISGPIIGQDRSVASGETVTISVADARAEVRSHREAPPIPEPSAPATAAAPLPTPATAKPVASAIPLSPAWRVLARAGKYAQALEKAKQDGIDHIAQTASAEDLALLADAARLAGDAPTASAALRTLRQRFAGEPHAAVAAFLLGRMAFDGRGDYTGAAAWFASYLEEQPAGPFAREALGRLVEARSRSGDTKGARAAARSYLKAYPDGPHAATARMVLDR